MAADDVANATGLSEEQVEDEGGAVQQRDGEPRQASGESPAPAEHGDEHRQRDDGQRPHGPQLPVAARGPHRGQGLNRKQRRAKDVKLREHSPRREGRGRDDHFCKPGIGLDPGGGAVVVLVEHHPRRRQDDRRHHGTDGPTSELTPRRADFYHERTSAEHQGRQQRRGRPFGDGCQANGDPEQHPAPQRRAPPDPSEGPQAERTQGDHDPVVGDERELGVEQLQAHQAGGRQQPDRRLIGKHFLGQQVHEGDRGQAEQQGGQANRIHRRKEPEVVSYLKKGGHEQVVQRALEPLVLLADEAPVGIVHRWGDVARPGEPDVVVLEQGDGVLCDLVFPGDGDVPGGGDRLDVGEVLALVAVHHREGDHPEQASHKADHSDQQQPAARPSGARRVFGHNSSAKLPSWRPKTANATRNRPAENAITIRSCHRYHHWPAWAGRTGTRWCPAPKGSGVR